jgi:hypothetical protein
MVFCDDTRKTQPLPNQSKKQEKTGTRLTLREIRMPHAKAVIECKGRLKVLPCPQRQLEDDHAKVIPSYLLIAGKAGFSRSFATLQHAS